MHLQWQFQEISLNQILESDTIFDWDHTPPSETLTNSIQHHGLLFPLVVQAVNREHYRVLDGFKRYRLLQEATNTKEATYSCLVTDETMSLTDLLIWRLETLSHNKTFPGITVCRILLQLHQAGIDEIYLAERVLPNLGIKSSKKRTQEFLKLAQWLEHFQSPPFQQCTPDELLPLLKFSSSTMEPLIKSLAIFHVGGNKWKSLLHLLYEVSRLQERSALEILQSQEIAQILHSSHLQSPVRYRLVKQQLEIWRYPELTQLRNKFAEGIHQLRLPPQINVQCDPFFEQDDLQVTVHADTPEALQAHLTSLHDSNKLEIWRRLFHVIQGG